MLASGLPQSDHLSNHTYELSTHIEVLARLFIPFTIPLLVLIKEDTLGKACIGDIFQIHKIGYNNSLQLGDSLAIYIPQDMAQSSSKLPIIQDNS